MAIDRGVRFRCLHSSSVLEDGSALSIWIECSDGSIWALYVPIGEVEQRVVQIEESQHSPRGLVLN